jgi:hypothetical protein
MKQFIKKNKRKVSSKENNFTTSESVISNKDNNFMTWLTTSAMMSQTDKLNMFNDKAEDGKEFIDWNNQPITVDNRNGTYQKTNNNIESFKNEYLKGLSHDQNILRNIIPLVDTLTGPKKFEYKGEIVPEGFDANGIKVNDISKSGFLNRNRTLNYTLEGSDNYKPTDPNKLKKQNINQEQEINKIFNNKDLKENESDIPVLNQDQLKGAGYEDYQYSQPSNIKPSTTKFNPQDFPNMLSLFENGGYYDPNTGMMFSEGGPVNPNSEVKKRYIKDINTHVVTPDTGYIFKNQENNPDEVYYPDNDFGEEESFNPGVYSDVSLINGVNLLMSGDLNGREKMLKKVNRNNFLGYHGFRGKDWKNGMSKEEIDNFKKENPFFEKGRKRIINYDLRNNIDTPEKRVEYKHLDKAEMGTFFPTDGYDPTLLNDMFGSKGFRDLSSMDPSQLTTTHGSMDFTKALGDKVAENTGTPKTELDPRPSPYEDDSPDLYEGNAEFKRVSRFKDNPAAQSLAISAGINTINAIGNKVRTNKREEALRKKISDPFSYYGVSGSDRGDYMFNTPTGPNFRPDDYTRIGYGTKNASLGLEVGSELELSDAEIEALKEQGYEIEYLD